MEGITLGQVVFGVVSLMMAVCSVLAVTSGRILRAATALLFVLFGTVGQEGYQQNQHQRKLGMQRQYSR